MKHSQTHWLGIGTATMLLVVALSLAARSADPAADGRKAASPQEVQQLHQVELQGRIVCIPEAMHLMYGTELPSRHEHVYGLETGDRTFYTLLRTKYSEALFVEERLREKELLLKGRVFPKSHVFDVTRTRSVKGGVIYDVYYYCSVCHIESVSPGPCECCQGPVELTEKPLRQ